MLSFEGEQFAGQQSIYDKLTSFNKLTHVVNTCDVQPTTNDGVVAFVSGQLSIDDGPAMMFSQTFVLHKGGAMGYYVHNDVFRLNLAG